MNKTEIVVTKREGGYKVAIVQDLHSVEFATTDQRQAWRLARQIQSGLLAAGSFKIVDADE